eukprot:2860393-Rhodomonas_salina.2
MSSRAWKRRQRRSAMMRRTAATESSSPPLHSVLAARFQSSLLQSPDCLSSDRGKSEPTPGVHSRRAPEGELGPDVEEASCKDGDGGGEEEAAEHDVHDGGGDGEEDHGDGEHVPEGGEVCVVGVSIPLAHNLAEEEHALGQERLDGGDLEEGGGVGVVEEGVEEEEAADHERDDDEALLVRVQDHQRARHHDPPQHLHRLVVPALHAVHAQHAPDARQHQVLVVSHRLPRAPNHRQRLQKVGPLQPPAYANRSQLQRSARHVVQIPIFRTHACMLQKRPEDASDSAIVLTVELVWRASAAFRRLLVAAAGGAAPFLADLAFPG